MTTAPAASAAAHPAWKGWALGLAATFCFSLAPTVARGAISAGMDPTALLVGRLWLATLLLGALMLATQPRELAAGRRCIAISAAAGIVNGVGMLLFFWALTTVEASMAAMVIALNPLLVLSLLALRGERFTYRHGVRLALALAGAYLLLGPGGAVDGKGLLLLVVALVGFAANLVIIQWYLIGYPARAVTFWGLAGMSVTIGGYWLATGAAWSAPGATGWLSIILLAVVSTFASRLLMFAAITHIGGGQMSLLGPLETLLTVVWSMLFLGERLAPVQALGGALILASAVLAVQRLNLARFRPRWRLWART